MRLFKYCPSRSTNNSTFVWVRRAVIERGILPTVSIHPPTLINPCGDFKDTSCITIVTYLCSVWYQVSTALTVISRRTSRRFDIHSCPLWPPVNRNIDSWKLVNGFVSLEQVKPSLSSQVTAQVAVPLDGQSAQTWDHRLPRWSVESDRLWSSSCVPRFYQPPHCLFAQSQTMT